MPSIPPTLISTRKRTRSTNVTENNHDHQHPVSSLTRLPTPLTTTSISHSTHTTNTASVNAAPKRQRNNPPPTGPPPAPPVAPRTTYSLRNRSLTPDPRHPLTRFPSVQTPLPRTPNRPRYNLRPRRPQSQVRLPQVPTTQPVITPRRNHPLIPPINPLTTTSTISASSSVNLNQSLNSSFQTSTIVSSLIHPPTPPPPPPPPLIPVPPLIPPIANSTPPVVQPRQYRLVYISDDDDEPQAAPTVVNTTLDLVTDDDDDELMRTPLTPRQRSSRPSVVPGVTTRFRTITAVPSSAVSTSSSSSSSSSSSTSTTINTQDFISGVAYIRLNRAIEIVIDSIQSLEGAVNSFDQLVFGFIYGRLGTRGEADSIESMIRLSRILNLNIPSRLTQDEIDSLPKISFINKTTDASSILLAEKCPICLTEFNDQEIINKLHCTHLFHLQCISTWLNENDSCPTCRRKVMGD